MTATRLFNLPPLDYSDEWWTPPHIFDALGVEFDLDPCAPDGGVPWVPAKKHCTAPMDGLRSPWEGTVWMNPPYSHVGRWMSRFTEHNNGIALAFARTDTAWFQSVAPVATGLCFIRGRLRFHSPAGVAAENAPAPSVLIGLGDVGRIVGRCGLGYTVRPG